VRDRRTRRGYIGREGEPRGTNIRWYSNGCFGPHVDPIKKKPFLHFCRDRWLFRSHGGLHRELMMCQNWEIYLGAPVLVRGTLPQSRAVGAMARSTVQAVAYTYSVTVCNYDNMMDSAEAARAAGCETRW